MSRRVLASLCLVLCAFITGCASPRYVSEARYEPPADEAGRACLAGCESRLQSCRDHCAGEYDACVRRIEPQLETAHREALDRYANDLDIYRRQLDRYRLEAFMARGWPHAYGGRFYSPWPEPWYPPPVAPAKPDRAKIFERMKREQCPQDCGCQPGYDACFIGCGGRLIREMRCVADCPKPQ